MFSESFEIDLQVLKVKSNKPSNQPKSTHKCNPITCSKNNNLKPTSSTQSKASRTSMNIMNSLIVRKMLKSRIQEKLERATQVRLYDSRIPPQNYSVPTEPHCCGGINGHAFK